MITFFMGIGILIVGYFTYGQFLERLFKPDANRITPAVKNDAAYEDRQALANWKCMLLHFLHIAGVGPVVGVILGAKFGPIVFLIIPIGNILGGAVHDYFSGMISIRNGAKSYLEVSKKFFTKQFAFISTMFIVITLFALSTSFTNVGAGILSANKIIDFGDANYSFVLWVSLIFLYYMFSTFFPITSFVSNMSYIFGTVLVVSTLSLIFLGVPLVEKLPEVDLWNFAANFTQHPDGQRILPMLFVTIACGMISGFHGSQNPITAGIVANETKCRQIFYGMMVLEGLLAMIWAAVGIIGYQFYPELLKSNDGPLIISQIIRGIIDIPYLSELILLGIAILAITTADAALRTLRILISDAFKFQQRSSEDRFLLCLPILGICIIMVFWSNITDSFIVLWNYFSLANQAIAVMCLAVSLCYLRAKNKPVIYVLCPLAFIAFVVFLYLFWISPEHVANAPKGFGLGYPASCVIAAICSFFTCWYCMSRGKYLSRLTDKKAFSPDE